MSDFVYKLYTLDNQFIEEVEDIPINFTGIVDGDSIKFYFKNGHWNRIDGPAVEYQNGLKEWYFNSKRHRIGGTAIEGSNNKHEKEYWIDGKQVSKEQHDLIFNTMKLKNLL